MPQYLSTDPNAGTPLRTAQAAPQAREAAGGYLTMDPDAGRSPAPAAAAAGPPLKIPSPYMWSRVGDAALETARGAAQMLLPSTTASDYVTGPLYAARHPIESVNLLLDALKGAHADQAHKTAESARRVVSAPTLGGKVAALAETEARGLATAIPVIGPALAVPGESFARGDAALGLGQTIGLLAPFGAARLRAPGAIGGFKPTANPTEAAAVAFGEARGIPLDAATVTGRSILRNVQKRLSGVMGGAPVVERARDAQAAALSRVGGELADSVHPAAVDAVTAGEGIQKALTDLRGKYGATADAAYDKLRAIEAAAPPQTRPTHPGGKFQSMRLAVDVRPAKAAMKAIYDLLKREAELVPLQGDKARTLVALDRLMNAPDFAPLSVADAALGELKMMGRVKDGALRTNGKGIIAETVRNLDAQVLDAARKSGPDAVQALRDGRQATIGKYQTDGALTKLNGVNAEPRRVFDTLTRDRDAALVQLRNLASRTPAEIPKLARAFLEELLDKARSKGKFEHTDALLAEWERLGPETKRLLFPTQATDLDNFFRLAQKINENANPSGTAQVLNGNLLNPWNWLQAIPSNALARTLYSKGGVQRVVNGIKTPNVVVTKGRLGAVTSTTASAQRPRLVPKAAENDDRDRKPGALAGR